MRLTLCVLALLASMFFAACGAKKLPPQTITVREVVTETVREPVPVKTPIPPELLAAFKDLVLPLFVSPSDPQASSALTPDGERQWLAFLERVKAIQKALEAMAAQP